MSLEAAIVALLEADAGMVAAFDSRIFPLRIPTGYVVTKDSPDLPALTYAVISDRHDYVVPVATARLQVTVFAHGYAELVDSAQVVLDCLHRYKGEAQLRVTHLDTRDLDDPSSGLPMRVLDFQVFRLTN